MELQHVNVKIDVDGDLAVDPERFIPIFHRWIKDHVLEGLLIDVADYRHVPSGPGVMLIGHEADFSMDNSGGQYGLLYNRKATLEGSSADRFGEALSAAARACCLLEEEFSGDGSLKFSRSGFTLIINDRALAPNTPETFAAVKDELTTFLDGTGLSNCTLTHLDDPRSRFAVRVTTATPLDLAGLSS